MTLLFIDSFDHYDDAELSLKWTVVAGTPTIEAVGRNSTNGLEIVSSETISKTFPGGNQASIVVGVAFKIFNNGGISVFKLMDTSTIQLEVRPNAATLQLELYRGTTLIATSVDALSIGVYYYIELKATIADAGGVAIVRVNSIEWINFSGDTKQTANAYATNVLLGRGAGGGGTFHYDDFYLCNQSGSVNNNFLGDIRIEAILPSGAGNSAQWTPSAGANYENVDETPPDEDTTYNSSLTPTNLDLFAMANLVSTSGSIKGIQTLRYTRKDDAGARIIRRAIRTGATNYFGSNESISLQTYAYFHEIVENNPNTTNPWTISEVNAIEAGYELVS